MTHPPSPLYLREQRTLVRAAGPLVVAERAPGVALGEQVEVVAPDGGRRAGQVIEVDGERVVIQVLEGTRGLDLERTLLRWSGALPRVGVGSALLGRCLDGQGRPLDGGPPPLARALRPQGGEPYNPVVRARPTEFIQTGVSAIDGMNTLVRGQKLPVFSGFGLPAGDLAARIATQARVVAADGREDPAFAVVFAAVGITRREASEFQRRFAERGALSRTLLLLNLADDPSPERLAVPRTALTVAEHLAFDLGLHVLVVVTDMTRYCEALREVATAQDEMPGRRGYPGAMYTDLARIYERAGRLRGRQGSVTQLIVLTMPEDDITHPIPDLTGYITEGQIVLSRDLHGQGIDPPIDVLPSLSRLMTQGIGEGLTRGDHGPLANQLYALYARGRDLRRLVLVIGEAALSADDRRVLAFADAFERRFVHQGGAARALHETLDLGWDLLAPFPDRELKRIPTALLEGRRSRAPDAVRLLH